MKAQCVPLASVAITALTGTTGTVLRPQDVQTMPDSGHLTVELLHGRVVLTERLGLLHHRKIQRLVTNLISAAEVSPHRVRGRETTEGQRDVNLHTGEQDSLGTGLLTYPGRLCINS
jgi:hypothetical protein